MRPNARFLCALGLFILGAVAAMCVALTLGAGGEAQAAAGQVRAARPEAVATCVPGWTAVDTPNVGPNENALTGVAVVSPTDVWAVGFYTSTSGVAQTLIMHYDGTAWATVPSPNAGTGGSFLQGVNARTATDIWAVGYYFPTTGGVPQTLALHYDGSSWTQATSASPGAAENYLYGVTAVSANDAWAVGYYANTAGLYRTLTLRWNGTQWNHVQSPNPTLGAAGLRGVTFITANDVWAVGVQADITLNYRMYALRWNGSQWVTTSTPSTVGCVLTAVAPATNSELWAVGGCQATTYQTAIIRWTGSSWTTVSSPSPGTGDNLLGGVVSAGPSEAFAVGGYNDTGGPTRALALYWNGVAWTVIPADNPGSSSNALVAISNTATAPSAPWAVGSKANGGPSQTLAERFSYLCATPTATPAAGTPSSTSTSTPTPTPTLTSTRTPTVAPPTGTQGLTATATSTPTDTATAQPTACALSFTDVDPNHTFYPFIRCLACRNIINGYTTGCPSGNPCFRPENNVTRGQVAKIVSNAAGFSDPIANQSFEDVPVGSTFHEFVGRLAMRGIVGGYACGGPGEPCNPPLNLPYFRPNANVTRGQLAKMDSEAVGYSDVPSGQQFEDVAQGSTFYTYTYRLAIRTIMSGYACGGTGEPCNPPLNLPYFRPGNPATRGQTAKIVANTFYPNCQTP